MYPFQDGRIVALLRRVEKRMYAATDDALPTLILRLPDRVHERAEACQGDCRPLLYPAI